MRSRRIAFSTIAALLISSVSSLSHDAAAIAASTAGTVEFSSAANGAVQQLGVKLIGVSRTGGSSGAASVLCRTANGTATSGANYTAASETLSWANGDSTVKYCRVQISDAAPFAGQKTFAMHLSGATGAVVGTPASTTVTIYGNGTVGRVELSAPTYSVAQKAGSLKISIDRTGSASGWAAVSYATANGTAVAGTDYTSERGAVSWANGDMSPKTINIPISNAKPFAGTKTLAVAIAGAKGALMGTTNTHAIVTIDGDGAGGTTTGTATLSWTAPTVDTNGEPITDLAGYNIYYGKSRTTMTSVIAVNSPASGSYVVKNLAAGTWYFAVAAYNTQAMVSPLTAVVSKSI
jgi:Calx-beta domain/Fibronectin type III domain